MTKTLLFSFTMAMTTSCGAQEPASPKKHHIEGGFTNNYYHLDKGFSDVTKWWWERTTPEPKFFPLAKNDPAFLKSNKTEPTITWVGHSTFLIQIDGINILTDPHFTERASPVSFAGPKRYTQPGLSLDDLPQIDFVIISHDHYDHLDLTTVKALFDRQPENPPVFFTGLKVKARFEAEGITSAQEYDWWESTEIKGFNLHCVPVQHFSGRSLTDRNSTLWCGWIIERNGYQIFFGGDTGYSKDFKDIHDKFGDMDLSLIPVGAYDPRWFMASHHVNPEEAIQIHRDLNSKLSIGMHWGTFILTDEPVDEPPVRLAKGMQAIGPDSASFTVMQHGETRILNLNTSKKTEEVAEIEESK
ncbi:MAG: MBL fold metallo-hydrolase [Bacteroidetes bacterium]|nr:MBL fold metallo-hydrolase [Bacteroidota bacterium]